MYIEIEDYVLINSLYKNINDCNINIENKLMVYFK